MTDASDTEALLQSWAQTLTEALGVTDLTVDVQEVLALAADAAHLVVRPAAPLSTFVVGYAAGLAAARGAVPETAAHEATEVARRACRERPA